MKSKKIKLYKISEILLVKLRSEKQKSKTALEGGHYEKGKSGK